MPCTKYKSKKQKKLCYLTREWSDWSKIKYIKKEKFKKNKIERYTSYDHGHRHRWKMGNIFTSIVYFIFLWPP